MGLTSRALEYVVVLFAVLCVALTAWLWPRLARTGPLTVVGRLGTIAVTQTAVLCAFALAINTNFEFYGSWNELLGHVDKAPAQVTALGATGPNSAALAAPGGLVQPAGPQGLDTIKDLPRGAADEVGRVDSVRITGRRSRAINPAFVYLPPQYFQKQFHRQRFPVIVAISGYPGGIMNLAQHLRVPQTAAGLLSANKMQPTVIVMLRPTIAPPRDTECVDVPSGPQAETYFVKDLPEALKRTYRVGHDPSAWGALGYSSGGSCALQLAMRNPGVYTSAAALSANYQVGNDLTTGNLFGNGPAGERRKQGHDLLWRLENLPQPRISVLVASSRQGENDYGDTMKFLAAVKPPMTSAKIILDQGSHHFTTWRREIGPALQWMSGQLTFPQDTTPNKRKPPTKGKPGEAKATPPSATEPGKVTH
ncbi:alpha/beta hydrolase [Streptomyces sp. NPDC058001]|uniref:alpha/beta hydrolase n=1 Tax=Streptomyces sp. NPDC058001 TaxID=3346300 RepID=UPI0036F0D8A9